MTKGLIRSLSRGPKQSQPMAKVTYTLDSLAVSVAGTTGVGFGTAVIGDLPEGHILVLGTSLQGTFTEASASIVDTFDGDVSVGSAANGDTSLTGAEVDLLPSTAIPQAVASVATLPTVAAGLAPLLLDNTDGSLELNLNILIDDADISGDDDVTVDGTFTIVYTLLGDN